MRRVFYILGSVAAAVVVAAGIGLGILFQRGYALDADAQAYVDEAIPAVASAQGQRQLLDRATPELRQSAEPAALNRIFNIFSRLGRVVEYQGAKGEATMSYHTGTGSIVSAHYVAKARFEHGDATMEITLMQRDGRWMIDGFHIDTTPISAAQPRA